MHGAESVKSDKYNFRELSRLTVEPAEAASAAAEAAAGPSALYVPGNHTTRYTLCSSQTLKAGYYGKVLLKRKHCSFDQALSRKSIESRATHKSDLVFNHHIMNLLYSNLVSAEFNFLHGKFV